jgi:hypothetical protein
MFGIVTLHNGKRNMVWAVVPLCLMLIFFGMRVPSLDTGAHAPKPHPRAVIETATRSVKEANAKSVAAVELPHNVTALPVETAGRSRFVTGACRFSSIKLTRNDARAPPVPC